MYGHVITKFSGMGRFTYPWSSAGALRAPELRYYSKIGKLLKIKSRRVKVNRPFALRRHVTLFYENESYVVFSSKNDLWVLFLAK